MNIKSTRLRLYSKQKSMITIKPENMQRHLCVLCDKFIELGSYWKCKKCNKVCQTIRTNIEKSSIQEVKSACCYEDVINHQKITCSDECHEKFVEKMVSTFGENKKITDEASGISYRVRASRSAR